MAPAVPCKTSKNSQHGVTRSTTNDFKSKLACILEANESTRLRMGESLPNHHEDHIARKGDNSLQHYNLVYKLIPMPQAMKIPAVRAAVDKECEKLENFSAWNLTKVRSKKEEVIGNLEEHCPFWEVLRLFQSAGCVRNKLKFRTVQQNQKSFLWMQD